MLPWLITGLVVVGLAVGRVIYNAEADDKKRKR
ncbi:MAG: hypothetical protein QOI98_3665 [Solirubrobacteraceae bacterium]|jgi:hypothetical protein|nr:hypothetical protein [Solirubrobacteraceae bacterium]